jgi:hypothetical protein
VLTMYSHLAFLSTPLINLSPLEGEERVRGN